MTIGDAIASDLFPARLDSDRLVYRGVGTDDVTIHDVRRLFGAVDDAEAVFSQISWTPHDTAGDSIDYLEARESEWEDGERAEYLIHRHRDDPDEDPAIGACYMRFDDAFTTCTFGMWLRRPHWGNGYASERADRFLRVAFDEIGVEQVRVGCIAANVQSRRSIEKYVARHGGQYDGAVSTTRTRYGGGRECVPHHEYTITRKQYRADADGISTNIPGVAYDDIDFQSGDSG